jgi:hypothetical protein
MMRAGSDDAGSAIGEPHQAIGVRTSDPSAHSFDPGRLLFGLLQHFLRNCRFPAERDQRVRAENVTLNTDGYVRWR